MKHRRSSILALVLTFALVLGAGLALPLVLSGSTVAAAEDMGPRTVDAVLADIRSAQNVAADSAIDVSKVSDDLLEQLGDAVMEARIGNSAMHERMDAMLGGDGSANLTRYHRDLGRAYLEALVAGKDPSTVGGPYGGGMMGGSWGGRTRGGMMGGSWTGGRGAYDDGRFGPGGAFPPATSAGALSAVGWIASIGGLVLLALAIALLVVLIVRFSRKPKAP